MSIAFIDNDPEVAAKEEEYYNRIGLHRNNVYKAFQKLIKDPSSEIIIFEKPVYLIADKLEPEIRNHDMSKFGDEEFYGYRMKWYPTLKEKNLLATSEEYRREAEEANALACQHHMRNNDHHPQWWCIDNDVEEYKLGDPSDMTIIAMLHMICDWEGMSMEVGGSTKQWWANNKADKSRYMTENTINFVDMIIDQMPGIEYPKKR